jgi:hypothetical protein
MSKDIIAYFIVAFLFQCLFVKFFVTAKFTEYFVTKRYANFDKEIDQFVLSTVFLTISVGFYYLAFHG